MMPERIKSLLIYAAKCICGTLTVFLIASLIGYKEISWCLISVMLVLSPDGKDAVNLALTRIKANLVGVSVALLCLLISPTHIWLLCVAITITLAICYLFKVEAGARSALAATLIIMLHDEANHLWYTAAERIISVMSGCLLGLLITFLFHFSVRKNENAAGQHHEA